MTERNRSCEDIHGAGCLPHSPNRWNCVMNAGNGKAAAILTQGGLIYQQGGLQYDQGGLCNTQGGSAWLLSRWLILFQGGLSIQGGVRIRFSRQCSWYRTNTSSNQHATVPHRLRREQESSTSDKTQIHRRTRFCPPILRVFNFEIENFKFVRSTEW